MRFPLIGKNRIHFHREFTPILDQLLPINRKRILIYSILALADDRTVSDQCNNGWVGQVDNPVWSWYYPVRKLEGIDGAMQKTPLFSQLSLCYYVCPEPVLAK